MIQIYWMFTIGPTFKSIMSFICYKYIVIIYEIFRYIFINSKNASIFSKYIFSVGLYAKNSISLLSLIAYVFTNSIL